MIKETGRRPLFSVVLPVFNDEAYVSEAIDSVLGQTIGLDHLELILVDDGSTDSTPQILDTAAARFPEHIKLIRQPNRGVSSALNAALEVATGEIITFLGSDDHLSSDSLELVAEFCRTLGADCDLVAIPIFLTGTRSGPHWNNRDRFETSRVIDVNDEWNLTQIAGGGSFIRASALDEAGLRFDPKLFVCEDLTLNTQVVLRKMKYGVVAGPKYFNRRYAPGGSLVSSAHFRPENYTDIPRHAHQRVLDAGRELHGSPPRYAQAVVAYELCWRFAADLSPMDPELRPAYWETLGNLLREIDIEVIMAQRSAIEVKLSMLDCREHGKLLQHVSRSELVFSLGPHPIYDLGPENTPLHRPPRCEIEFFEVDGPEIDLQGIFRVPEFDDLSFAIQCGDRTYPVERLELPHRVPNSLASSVNTWIGFRARVALHPGEQLRPILTIEDERDTALATSPAVAMGRYTRFCGSRRLAYYRRDDSDLFRQRGKHAIERRLLSHLGKVRAELGFLRRALRARAPLADLRLRISTNLRQATTKRPPTWLIADHKSEGGDNGEAMFRYLCERTDDNFEPCFALRKEAEEYEALCQLGRVVEPDSKAYLREFFRAEVVMNSAADAYMLDPLGRRRVYLNDLARHESVYLDHGITKDDQSAWQNRWAKGFDMFVTSSAREQESIQHERYGYRRDQIVLTGMPRFDLLRSAPDNLVVFAPTWRKHLSGNLNIRAGRNEQHDRFWESDYATFWQGVVLDHRLNDAMSRHGYRGVLALHGSHASEIESFARSERIEISRYPHDYGALFQDGSVLVTDYSSVAFDFAYLRKPVVYVQGDRAEFFENHLYSEGYFSYERDGFGPVVETAEELVDSLIACFEGSCEMSTAYTERVERFFEFSGGGNSERVRTAVLAKLESRQSRCS